METPKEVTGEVMMGALELIQRAEIDMQISTAKRYPRDLPIVKKRMLSFATLDVETAESCFYTLSRSGKKIQGPSVRLAEIAVACYGNLRAASRVISNDGKVVTSQAACHDLENNTLISVEVQRRITDKNGKTYSDDMQITASNAANAIAFRNAVFKVVPGALLKPVFEAAMKVAVGDASTLSTRREKVIARLEELGAELPRILHMLGKHSIENIDLIDLETLVGIGTAIKDGDTTVDESFPPINGTKHEAPADREARQEEKIRQQAEEPQVKDDGTKPEPPVQQTASSATTGQGFWPDRQTMLAAFHEKQAILGVDRFFTILGGNGIDGDADMVLNADNVVTAFKEIEQAIDDAKPKAETPKSDRPIFGRRERK